jgi:hypothetical protein
MYFKLVNLVQTLLKSTVYRTCSSPPWSIHITQQAAERRALTSGLAGRSNLNIVPSKLSGLMPRAHLDIKNPEVNVGHPQRVVEYLGEGRAVHLP